MGKSQTVFVKMIDQKYVTHIEGYMEERKMPVTTLVILFLLTGVGVASSESPPCLVGDTECYERRFGQTNFVRVSSKVYKYKTIGKFEIHEPLKQIDENGYGVLNVSFLPEEQAEDCQEGSAEKFDFAMYFSVLVSKRGGVDDSHQSHNAFKYWEESLNVLSKSDYSSELMKLYLETELTTVSMIKQYHSSTVPVFVSRAYMFDSDDSPGIRDVEVPIFFGQRYVVLHSQCFDELGALVSSSRLDIYPKEVFHWAKQ